MKQVININFQGRVVPIEVTAFELLKNYTESLNRHFANEEGKDEIINDIESRIGELFQERISNGATCITDSDVNAVINSMGRPEDFEANDAGQSSSFTQKQTGEESRQQSSFSYVQGKRLYRDESNKILGGVCAGLGNYFGIDSVIVRIIFVVIFPIAFWPYIIFWIAVPGSSSSMIGGVRKKLYRDGDDKIIAGVSSGIGHYFGINSWIPRVLFLLPFLSFVFSWRHWGMMDFPNFIRVGFSPGAMILYIILWLVLPEAITTAEKLEMKGEKVDLNSIKDSVKEEMKGFQGRAEKFGKDVKTFAETKGKTVGAEVGNIARRGSRSLGDVIVFIVKIFAYFVIGCVGIAIVIGLFFLGFAAITFFPIKEFILTDGWQNVFAWGTLLFFIATPIIGIITWIIRKLARIKAHGRMMRFTFISLWIVGWVCFSCLLGFVGKDFRSGNTLNEQEIKLSNPMVNKLEVTTLSPEQKFHRNHWFRLEPFEGLEEDTAYVKNVVIHIMKSPNDSFRVTMMKMVSGSSRRYADTLANIMKYDAYQKDSLLVLDRGIPITRKDKFRNQEVIITVYVPVGKQIRVDRNVGWGDWVHFGWNNNNDWEWNVEFDGIEHGWDENVDYIMKADGLYTLDGTPADENKHPEVQKLNEYKRNLKDNYRYNQEKKMQLKQDSMELRTQYKLDSIEARHQQQKDSLEKKQEQEKEKIIKSGVEPSAYLIPLGVPGVNTFI